MKWLRVIVVLAVLLAAGTYWYSTSFSATARAEATAKAFMQFAAAGQQASLESMLAPESRPMAPQMIADYRGIIPGSFHASRAMTNRSGVQMVVLVGFTRPGGNTWTTLLTMKEQDGKWVVMQAAKDLTY